KRVFRRAMRGLVPDAILDRRDKIGFITPQDTWLKRGGPWLAETLLSDRARAIPALSTAPYRRAAEIALGTKAALKPEVWRWANLIRWADIFDAEFAR
ncbi:MAG: asparagine synthase-related protein, partial [Rhodospirillaceae bacterium]